MKITRLTESAYNVNINNVNYRVGKYKNFWRIDSKGFYRTRKEAIETIEAIETLKLLLETLPKEEHKEINEAIEKLKMLK